MKRDPRRFDALEGGPGGAVLQCLRRIVGLAIAVGDMGVEVDQAGKHPIARPIDQPPGPLRSTPRLVADDLAVGQGQQPAVSNRSGPGVDQVAGMELDRLGGGWGGRQRQQGEGKEGSDHRA